MEAEKEAAEHWERAARLKEEAARLAIWEVQLAGEDHNLKPGRLWMNLLNTQSEMEDEVKRLLKLREEGSRKRERCAFL